MIRFALAGAAVWAAERAVRWLVRDPYEPRHPTRVVHGTPTRVVWYPTAPSVVAPEENYRDLGRGVLIDELMGEDA